MAYAPLFAHAVQMLLNSAVRVSQRLNQLMMVIIMMGMENWSYVLFYFV